MTGRVEKLRKQSIDGKPFITAERAKLVTEAYKKYSGKASQPVLRAQVFQYIMENKAISIQEGELIVGERGPEPLASPTYPELCCHTVRDLEIISGREKIAFLVEEEVKKFYMDEIIPFWKGKSIREQIFENMTPEWKESYAAGIFTEFMEQRAPGHTVADNKIYGKGFADFKLDIQKSMESLDFHNDPEALDKSEELKAMLICADAIIRLGERYSEKAAQMAKEEKDPVRRTELEKISEVTARVPAHAPRNMWEALQMYWFVHLGVITELNTWDSYNPGRLDQHLLPFYERDIKDGALTQESAKELLECFWVKFNNQPAPPKVGTTLEESGTYTDFANINVGGLKIDGSDGINEVSFLLLDVIDEMRLLQPSSNIQLSKKNPNSFLKRACQVISKGWGQPSVFNADAVIEEMLRQGKSIEDARCGGTSGCVETGAFGKEAYILDRLFQPCKDILNWHIEQWNRPEEPENSLESIRVMLLNFKSFEELNAGF